MVNKPKQIGTAGESAVVRYLVKHGWSSAERPAQHGRADEGDITGTPGVAWEVKSGKTAEQASDGLVDAWLAEAEAERVNRGADVAVLVWKRKGKGGPNAGLWWAAMPGWTYCALADLSLGLVAGQDLPSYPTTGAYLPAVRMTLADAVTLLRSAGYGDPIERNAA